MVTLTLEESHWFFVHGIRVHNKGGGANGGGAYCCCAIGYKWDGRQCVPCPGDGLANQGQECFEKCDHRSGPCPAFCGSGKCCRAQWHEPGAQIGPEGCGEYEGGDGKHICVGSAQPGLVHPDALCWDKCNHRSGRCDFCGDEGFCCRMNFSAEADLTGQDACFPGEGPPGEHRCVRREEVSCDAVDLIPESSKWWSCGNLPQLQCDYKSKSTYCCCDKAYRWNVNSQLCDVCDGHMAWVEGGELKGSAVDSCPGHDVINSTIDDGFCHASQHMHSCTKPGGFGIFWLVVGMVCCGCCVCCACSDQIKAQGHNAAARECQRQGHYTRQTTCTERAQHDSSYREGWYCDLCNKYTRFSDRPFQRCDACGVDFCDECLVHHGGEQQAAAPLLVQGAVVDRPPLTNYAAGTQPRHVSMQLGVQPIRTQPPSVYPQPGVHLVGTQPPYVPIQPVVQPFNRP